MSTPDGIEPLRGFRAWKCDFEADVPGNRVTPVLVSGFDGTVWQPGWNEASCGMERGMAGSGWVRVTATRETFRPMPPWTFWLVPLFVGVAAFLLSFRGLFVGAGVGVFVGAVVSLIVTMVRHRRAVARWEAESNKPLPAVEEDAAPAVHVAPDKDCHCGFYGVSLRRAAHDYDVVGLIEGAGKVIPGTQGFRAQKARVVCLFASGEVSWPTMAALAERYGVPVEADPMAGLPDYRGYGS